MAADARRIGDGQDLGLAKVVASLIGVPVDDVRKRQAITQDWWIKVTAAVITVVAVLLWLPVPGLAARTRRRDRLRTSNGSRH